MHNLFIHMCHDKYIEFIKCIESCCFWNHYFIFNDFQRSFTSAVTSTSGRYSLTHSEVRAHSKTYTTDSLGLDLYRELSKVTKCRLARSLFGIEKRFCTRLITWSNSQLSVNSQSTKNDGLLDQRAATAKPFETESAWMNAALVACNGNLSSLPYRAQSKEIRCRTDDNHRWPVAEADSLGLE